MGLSRDPVLVFDLEPTLVSKKHETYGPRLGGIPGRHRGKAFLRQVPFLKQLFDNRLTIV